MWFLLFGSLSSFGAAPKEFCPFLNTQLPSHLLQILHFLRFHFGLWIPVWLRYWCADHRLDLTNIEIICCHSIHMKKKCSGHCQRLKQQPNHLPFRCFGRWCFYCLLLFGRFDFVRFFSFVLYSLFCCKLVCVCARVCDFFFQFFSWVFFFVDLSLIFECVSYELFCAHCTRSTYSSVRFGTRCAHAHKRTRSCCHPIAKTVYHVHVEHAISHIMSV